MIKLIASGTTLMRNWSRQNGFIWPKLVKRIRQTIDTDTEEWKAIVRFQGESDSYSNSAAFGYQEDLTKFIADVRNEVYKVDSTAFNQSSDIPVVIVGLGCWVATITSHGSLVMKAQRRFVASTPNTAFVPTDDLSCDKHYDDASQLIIGARVANALKALLLSRTKLRTRSPSRLLT